MNSLKTRFTEDAKIQYPIIGGAMYPCSSPQLVAAVSAAGGIGIVQPISFTYVRHYDFRASLKLIQSITDKPFGLNIILMPGYEDRLKNWLDIALEEGCRFVITSLGIPTWVVERVHAAGGVVYHDVIKREHAQKAIDVGVDGIIAVNNRAGGHLGPQSAEALFDELQDLGKPLICAGGVGDEHAFIAALKLGYDGVQMATRFIATFECDETDAYKQAIIHANESDIVVTNKMDSVPAAVILNEYAKAQGLQFGPVMSWLMQQGSLKKWIRAWIAYRGGKKLAGTSEARWYSAGKSAGQIHEIESVAAIIQRFVKAAQATQ